MRARPYHDIAIGAGRAAHHERTLERLDRPRAAGCAVEAVMAPVGINRRSVEKHPPRSRGTRISSLLMRVVRLRE